MSANKWSISKMFLSVVVSLGIQNAWSLTSGPAMPEYNDFESVDNTDLVNLATGSFTYSIPLMTVPGPGLGFPIVLNYHAGIQPEQEASWVGLGWNIQAGAVTRQINNIPDDFKNEVVVEEITSQHIYGWTAAIAYDGYTVGISWDSEHGYGGMVGYSWSFVGGYGIGVTAGVNGVYDGVGVVASIETGLQTNSGIGLDAGYSIGLHSKRGFEGKGKYSASFMGLASMGVSLSTKSGANVGASFTTPGQSSTSVKGQVTISESNFTLPIPTPVGYFSLNAGSWDQYIDGLQDDYYYGFIYSDDESMNCKDDKNCYNSGVYYKKSFKDGEKAYAVRKMDYDISPDFVNTTDDSSPYKIKLGQTGEDLYSVQSQGISGSFKPLRVEDGDYYTYISNQDYTTQEGCKYVGWLGYDCDRDRTLEFGKYFEGEGGASPLPRRNLHTEAYSSREKLIWRFNDEVGGAVYSDPLNRDNGLIAAVNSKKILPLYSGNRLAGWIITATSGVQYVYTNPVYNFAEKRSGSAEEFMSKPTTRETPGYAYAWLLTAILSPDYVKMESGCEDFLREECLPKPGDVGGWVRVRYNEPGTITWRTPFGIKGDPIGLSAEGKPFGYATAEGVKSFRYLESIETPTHIANFNIADQGREDGLPGYLNNVGFHILNDGRYVKKGTSEEPKNCYEDLFVARSNPQWMQSIFIANEELGGYPTGTQVSLMAKRETNWDKFTCEFYDYSMACGTFCRDGLKEQNLGSFKLGSAEAPLVTLPPDTRPRYFEVKAISTEIQSVRVILGEFNLPSVKALSFLKEITLKNKEDNSEVSSVRFGYDYSLAELTPNSASSKVNGQGGDKGRLTLKSVQIGATKNGPWQQPYKFEYNPFTNHAYSPDKKDFWGDFCFSCTKLQKNPDGTADAWNLSTIINPLGSKIEVEYEANRIDYAEGLPAVIDGDRILDYFEKNDKAINPCTEVGVGQSGCLFGIIERFGENKLGEPYVLGEVLKDRIKMDVEVANHFSGKKIAYLGLIESPLNSEISFEGIKKLPLEIVDHYVIESQNVIINGAIDFENIRQQTGENRRFRRAFSGTSLLMGMEDVTTTKFFNNPNCKEENDCYNERYGSGYDKWSEKLDASIEDIENVIKKSDEFFPKLKWLSSNRLQCPHNKGLLSCHYSPGFITTSLESKYKYSTKYFSSYFAFARFFTNPDQDVQQPSKIPSLPTHIRVWAVLKDVDDNQFNENAGIAIRYGGGVRVKTLKMVEPFSGKVNQISYKYGESATPTLPQSGTNFSNEYKYRSTKGLKPFLGNPGVLYGTVRTIFTQPDAQAFETEYNFVTSNDLPVTWSTKRLVEGDPLFENQNNLKATARFIDLSGLWGSLWRRTDKNSQGLKVKEDQTKWSLALGLAHKGDPSKTKVIGPNDKILDLIKNGETILNTSDPNLKVIAIGEDKSKENLFGVGQKLWSNRYVSENCDSKKGEEEITCLENSGGAISTQMEVLRFNPFVRFTQQNQDFVKKTGETNLFDFRTAIPMLSINPEYKKDGTVYFATLTSLAYHQRLDGSELASTYQGMFVANMLDQEFSKTIFKFDQNPTGLDFTNLSQQDLNKVVSSNYTQWRNYAQGTKGRFRKSASYTLRNATNFSLPSPESGLNNLAWKTLDQTLKYDDFGHPIEVMDPSGKKEAYIYDYGKGLPSAFVQNAAVDQVFYQSFETKDFISSLIPGLSIYRKISSIGKTGAHSLKVLNCLEKNAAGTITKDECGPAGTNSFICLELPKLPLNQSYIASAWYFDGYQGSNMTDPNDNFYWSKETKVTRPGIFIGDQFAPSGCAVEAHPNGAMLSPGTRINPSIDGDWNADQRATGSNQWKKIWVEFTPGSTCSANGFMDKPMLCLYASKWMSGSDINYDEVRVRPKNSRMSTFAYDSRGNMISSADLNEVVTAYKYDGLNNLSAIKKDGATAITQRGKNIPGPATEYDLIQLGEYIDGCERIKMTSNPQSENVEFRVTNIDAKDGRFEIKKDSKGIDVPTICHENWLKKYSITTYIVPSGKTQNFVLNKNPEIIFNGCESVTTGDILVHDKDFSIKENKNKCYNISASRQVGNQGPGVQNNSTFGFNFPRYSDMENAGGKLLGYDIEVALPKIKYYDLNPSGLDNWPLHVRFDYEATECLRDSRYDDRTKKILHQSGGVGPIHEVLSALLPFNYDKREETKYIRSFWPVGKYYGDKDFDPGASDILKIKVFGFQKRPVIVFSIIGHPQNGAWHRYIPFTVESPKDITVKLTPVFDNSGAIK